MQFYHHPNKDSCHDTQQTNGIDSTEREKKANTEAILIKERNFDLKSSSKSAVVVQLR
jgi:hypothetical protein